MLDNLNPLRVSSVEIHLLRSERPIQTPIYMHDFLDLDDDCYRLTDITARGEVGSHNGGHLLRSERPIWFLLGFSSYIWPKLAPLRDISLPKSELHVP